MKRLLLWKTLCKLSWKLSSSTKTKRLEMVCTIAILNWLNWLVSMTLPLWLSSATKRPSSTSLTMKALPISLKSCVLIWLINKFVKVVLRKLWLLIKLSWLSSLVISEPKKLYCKYLKLIAKILKRPSYLVISIFTAA